MDFNEHTISTFCSSYLETIEKIQNANLLARDVCMLLVEADSSSLCYNLDLRFPLRLV